MDDDLKVTEKTDLEKLLEIIEDLNFDLIGAMFENFWFQIKIIRLTPRFQSSECNLPVPNVPWGDFFDKW